MSKTNIAAEIHLHSVNPQGVELVTWILKYPRLLHSEFLTHRAFSRNASSSRAIPIGKMMDAVLTNCATPEFWGANKSGMQASEQVEFPDDADLKWRAASERAVQSAIELNSVGLHKQIANRALEPFSHITVLASMTRASLMHFFALRAHKDAQPEFQVMAFRMLAAYMASKPKPIRHGDWHIPFDPDPTGAKFDINQRLKISVARAARVSYLNFEGDINPEKDMALFEKLSSSDPAHASAFEHAAKARNYVLHSEFSNFEVGYMADGDSGWLQYRKTLQNEFNPRKDLAEIMASKPEWITL